MPVYKQLPNAKMYNKNGDQIDPFCKDKLNISSEDNSINVSKTDTGYDISLNTELVELIDFTNFHNYYIREVTDWTSQYNSTLKHHVIHCTLSNEDLTIVDNMQATGDSSVVNDYNKKMFYYERSTAADDVVYIPIIATTGTSFTCTLNVAIQFSSHGDVYNTQCIVLGDNPSDLTWCWCKNTPFNFVGKVDDRTPNGQLYEFIEIPAWFTGRIEISIYKINASVLGTVFTLCDNGGTLSVESFEGTGTYELYAFEELTSYNDGVNTRVLSDIVVTPVDKYGVLDVAFFVDNINVLEIQSDNSIPDWIINDLCAHEVALRNRMNEIILRNTQLNFDNYYTKTEVDTALGNKQASITITDNTEYPTDNDTIIMQESGTTNTTTFLRRTMSRIWDYIKSKSDSMYYKKVDEVVNMTTLLNYNPKFYSTQDNDFFYAYDKRPNVAITWKTYDIDNDELISDNSSDIYTLFRGVGESTGLHPKNGEYDIIEISKSDSSNIIQYLDGPIWITFYYQRPPEQNPIIKATLANEEVLTLACTKFIYSSTCVFYRFDFPSGKVNLRSLNIKIIGKSFGTNLNYGAFPVNIYFTTRRRSLSQHSGVTKFPIKQDLYGEVEAPKFTVRGGTSQQVLLANGATINMPSTTGTNKDTLLKNLVSGLSNGTSTVTDTTEIVTSYAGANGFNTTNYVNVPYKRPMTKVWDYIKGKADSIYVSTAASQGLNSTEKSNAKANIGLGNVDNTSDATKKTDFTGSIANANTGFVTGGDVYTALNSRYKTITVTNDNYTDASLFNDVRPGDVIHLNMNTFSDGVVNISKCNHCFIILESVPDLFKFKNGTSKITVTGNLHGVHTNIIVYMEHYKFYVLSNVSDENALLCTNAAMNGGIMMYPRTSESKIAVVFDSEHPVTRLVMNITNEEDLLILNHSSYVRAINSFGDIQHPSDPTKCSTFDGFFPTDVIRYTNYSSWEELFVGCGFSLANDYTINPSHRLYGLKKAFYHAYSYNSHITNVDLTTTVISNTDLTSCFESADGFNVILDGVDLTNNTCTDMFKDAKNITISAIGCNQDTIDKINANISGSYTSTITVITTDPNA